MDFTLTEEQQTARSVAASIFEPRSGSLVDGPTPPEGPDWFDREAWSLLADSDMLGLSLSEEVGGSGFGLLETCVLLEEQGRHLIRIPAVEALAVAGPAIETFGSDDQKNRWLPGLVAGTTILTVALGEPRSYDPSHLQTRVNQDGDGWRLDGEKFCVPFAKAADAILVPAPTGDDQVVVFVVPTDADGLSLTAQETTNGQPEYIVELDGVAVGDEDRLGPADGDSCFEWMIDRATVATCAVQLGVAEKALEMTASYTSEREQFERPIATFQAVAMRAADSYFDVESIRVTLWQAAWRMANGLDAGDAIAVAKFWASEGGERVTAAAQHLHGGIGVDTDYPLHRYTLWSKRNELVFGSAKHHLDQLGRSFASAPQGERIAAFS